jgi:RNA polymerase sigma-70 factor (ECF subfamily)
MDYEQVVASYYEGLYGFAYSLAGNKDDACELAQETFARLLAKSDQVRDRSKIKSWLFTTLYRIYLGWKRREARLPHLEIASVEHELPSNRSWKWKNTTACLSCFFTSKIILTGKLPICSTFPSAQ